MYCDSDKLEERWFLWILSSASPVLDIYREHGILWTKTIGIVEHDGKVLQKKGKPLADPSHPERLHCLAFANPIYLQTTEGVPQSDVNLEEIRAELNLTSNAGLHALDQPLKQFVEVVPEIQEKGYIKEEPTETHWHAILNDIHNICSGIATRFTLPNEDEQKELGSKAFIQVVEKLVSGRLKYTPGRAPVFNLLTTTIYRVMYSTLNKQTHLKHGIRRLLEDAEAGILPVAGRSIRVPPHSRTS